MLSKIRENLQATAKSKRGFGTSLLGVGLLLGFGLPMMAASWDINNMRTYQVDVDNMVQIGLLNLRARTNNTFHVNDAQRFVKGTVACNLNPQNLGPSMKASSQVCSEYTSDRSGKRGVIKRYGDGRRVSSFGNGKQVSFGTPQKRPNLTVTDVKVIPIGARGNSAKSVEAYATLEYTPVFLKGITGNKVKTIKTKERIVNAYIQDNTNGSMRKQPTQGGGSKGPQSDNPKTGHKTGDG